MKILLYLLLSVLATGASYGFTQSVEVKPAKDIPVTLEKAEIRTEGDKGIFISLKTPYNIIPDKWPKEAIDGRYSFEVKGVDSTGKVLEKWLEDSGDSTVGLNNYPMGINGLNSTREMPDEEAEWIDFTGSCIMTPYLQAQELGPIALDLEEGTKWEGKGVSIEVLEIQKKKYVSQWKKEEVAEEELKNEPGQEIIIDLQLEIKVPKGERFHEIDFAFENKKPLESNNGRGSTRYEVDGSAVIVREFKSLPPKAMIFLETSKEGEKIHLPLEARLGLK